MALPLTKVPFKFNGRNAAAQARAAAQAARYVTAVSEETRQAINQLIVNSLRDGISARETSQLIESAVGLTSQGSAAVSNFFRELVKRGTNEVRANLLADKYAKKLLKVRALTIARTEIMGALNAGSLEQAQQRRSAGLFQDPVKTWSITPDEVTCVECADLDGETVPLDEPFSIGVMAPPAHPNCRCSPTYSDHATTAAPAPAPGRWNLQGEARQRYAQELLARRGGR